MQLRAVIICAVGVSSYLLKFQLGFSLMRLITFIFSTMSYFDVNVLLCCDRLVCLREVIYSALVATSFIVSSCTFCTYLPIYFLECSRGSPSLNEAISTLQCSNSLWLSTLTICTSRSSYVLFRVSSL